MNRLRILGCFVFAVTQFVVLTHAQESGFNKAEFTARRAKLFEQISDGVAVVFAAEEPGFLHGLHSDHRCLTYRSPFRRLDTWR